jgi:raffinose/stachyose/melibiose transport system permease protein
MRYRNICLSTIFIAPSFLFYTTFVIVPVILTAYYGMTDWDGIGKRTFIFLHNYLRLFADPDYGVVVRNTTILVLFSLVVQLPLGLLLAHLTTRVTTGFKFFRTVFFGPIVISAAIIAVMFSILLSDDIGPLNFILRKIGLGSLAFRWLADPRVVLFAVSLPQVWHGIGYAFIIFLAGLQTVPEEILESAKIDGASSVQVFFRILMPLIAEIFIMVIIICVTGTLRSFDYSWIMTWGGPGISSSFLAVYMYRLTFREFSMGYGSSVALSILLLSLFFTILFRFVTRRLHYEEITV